MTFLLRVMTLVFSCLFAVRGKLVTIGDNCCTSCATGQPVAMQLDPGQLTQMINQSASDYEISMTCLWSLSVPDSNPNQGISISANAATYLPNGGDYLIITASSGNARFSSPLTITGATFDGPYYAFRNVSIKYISSTTNVSASFVLQIQQYPIPSACCVGNGCSPTPSVLDGTTFSQTISLALPQYFNHMSCKWNITSSLENYAIVANANSTSFDIAGGDSFTMYYDNLFSSMVMQLKSTSAFAGPYNTAGYASFSFTSDASQSTLGNGFAITITQVLLAPACCAHTGSGCTPANPVSLNGSSTSQGFSISALQYLNYITCRWILVSAFENYATRMNSTSFNTEANKDNMTLYFTSDFTGAVIATSSGSFFGGPFFGNGSASYQFSTDRATLGTGFNINVLQIPMNSACCIGPGCSPSVGTIIPSTLTSSTWQVLSLAKEEYFPNMVCRWVLSDAGVASYGTTVSSTSFTIDVGASLTIYGSDHYTNQLAQRTSSGAFGPYYSNNTLSILFMTTTNNQAGAGSFNITIQQTQLAPGCCAGAGCVPTPQILDEASLSQNITLLASVYFRNMNCKWTLTSSLSSYAAVISANVASSFRMGSGDVLTLFWSDKYTNQLAQITGSNQFAGPYNTGSNGTFSMTLSTSSATNGTGFNLTVTQVQIAPGCCIAPSGCSPAEYSLIPDTLFQSLVVPAMNYFNDMSCKWTFTSSLTSYAVSISDQFFSLGSGDALIIYASNSYTDQMAQLISNVFGGPYYSNNTLSISFSTDSDHTSIGLGFNLTIQQIPLAAGCCVNVGCMPVPVILDPTALSQNIIVTQPEYLNNMLCRWTLHSALSNYATSASSVQFGTQANADLFIPFFNENFTNPIATISGTNFGGPFQSDGTISFQFSTDASITGTGFLIILHQLPMAAGCCVDPGCSASPVILDPTQLNQTILMPAAQYFENMLCRWSLANPQTNVVTVLTASSFNLTAGDVLSIYSALNFTNLIVALSGTNFGQEHSSIHTISLSFKTNGDFIKGSGFSLNLTQTILTEGCCRGLSCIPTPFALNPTTVSQNINVPSVLLLDYLNCQFFLFSSLVGYAAVVSAPTFDIGADDSFDIYAAYPFVNQIVHLSGTTDFGGPYNSNNSLHISFTTGAVSSSNGTGPGLGVTIQQIPLVPGCCIGQGCVALQKFLNPANPDQTIVIGSTTYFNDMVCMFSLTSNLTGFAMNVSATAFDIAASDTLSVYSSSVYRNVLTSITGPAANFAPVYSNNTLSVKFVTDHTGLAAGFTLSIQQIQLSSGCCTGVGCVPPVATLIADSSSQNIVVSSSQYFNNMNCLWSLNSSLPHIATFVSSSLFNTESKRDNFTIFFDAGFANPMTTISGTTFGGPYQSDETISFQFVTNRTTYEFGKFTILIQALPLQDGCCVDPGCVPTPAATLPPRALTQNVTVSGASQYFNNMFCQWSLHNPMLNFSIMLTALQFNLESGDHLTVYSSDNYNNALATLTDTAFPVGGFSLNNTLSLSFQSDGSGTAPGFNLAIKQMALDSGCCTGVSCVPIAKSLNGTALIQHIVLPSYQYLNNMQCLWTFTSSLPATDYASVLHSTSFNVAKGDSLLIYSSATYTNLIANLTNSTGFVGNVNSNYTISLRFLSGVSGKGTGFNITLTQAPLTQGCCVGVGCVARQSILLPASMSQNITISSSSYFNSMKCLWTMTSSLIEYSIIMSAGATSFNLGGGDQLSIYSTSTFANLLAVATGTSFNGPYYLNNTMSMEFVTDSTVSGTGFRILVQQLPYLPCSVPANNASTDFRTNCGSILLRETSCNPTCHGGFSAVDVPLLNCTATGLLVLENICNPNPCTRPVDTPSTIYSQVSCPNPTPSGSTCIPTCMAGYSPLPATPGSLDLVCLRGNFSAPVGQCKPSPCEIPDDTASTVYSVVCGSAGGSLPSGSICSPKCRPGYVASGNLSITCTAGIFSYPLGICNPSPCSPRAVENLSSNLTAGSCASSSIPSSESCVLGCSQGYVANGSLSLTCQNGNFSLPSGFCSYDWSMSLCSQPTPPYPMTPGNCPSNAVSGTACNLSCTNGYSPSLPASFGAYCVNTVFVYNTSSSVYCVPNPCNLPSLGESMTYGSCKTSTPSNSACTLGCAPGHLLAGSLSIQCTAGVFSLPLGGCRPSPCPQPTLAPSSFMTVGNCPAQTPSNSSCMLTCAEGYSSYGTLETSCLNGNFTQDGLGYCVRVVDVYTSATSTANPPLVGSPGSTLHVSISASPDVFVSNISIGGVFANNFRIPSFPPEITNSTLPIVVYLSIPSLSLFNTPFNFQASLLYLSVPTLVSACPDTIRVLVNQSVVVRGSGFYATAAFQCFLAGQTQGFSPFNIAENSVTCSLYYPTDGSGTTVTLNVANDGVMPIGQQPLEITLIGACQSEKSGSIAGLTGCECPRGTRDSGSACIECENGFYQDKTNQGQCLPCGNDRDTNNQLGSTSNAACVCRPGTYQDPSTTNCDLCKQGMICPGNNVIDINPGYWRSSNDSVTVLACPGGTSSCSGSTNESSSLCKTGYKGPLCTVCETGYAKSGEICTQCPSAGVNAMEFSAFVCFALAIAYGLIRTATALQNEVSSKAEEVDQDPSLGVILKVILNYMQVLYYIGRLSANWGDISFKFFTIIGQSTLTLHYPSVECAAAWSFYRLLLLMYLSPLIVTAALIVLYSLRHIVKQAQKTPWPIAKSLADCEFAVLLILYQIHPTIMLEVINSLPCVQIGGTSYLKADMSVDCSREAYRLHAMTSAIYLLGYIFGMIIFVSYRLWRSFLRGRLFQHGSLSHRKYSFFFVGYKRSRFYWEAIVMLRKLLIVALSIISNGMLELVWTGLVIMISLILNLQLAPYNSSVVNRLENMCLSVLYATVMLGFHFLATSSNHTWSTTMLLFVNGGMTFVLIGTFVVQARKRWLQRHSKTSRKDRSDNWTSGLLNNNAKDKEMKERLMQNDDGMTDI